MADTALGALQRQKLLDGGMAPSDVALWQQDQEQKLFAGGMSGGDIAAYFGQPAPDLAAIDKKIAPSLAIPGAKVATNMWESFLAGGQMGALNVQGGAPEFVMPVEAGWMETVAHGAGLTLSDAPLWLASFFGTTALAAETAVAAPFIGAGAATAATSTLRNVRIDAWTHPNDGLIGSKDWQQRAAGIATNVGVETAIGTASMGLGMVATKAATPILSPLVGETAAKIGAFTAGAAAPVPFLANTNSLMERGELAGPQDYAETTAQLIGSMALGPVLHVTGYLGKPSPKVSADNMSRAGQEAFDHLTDIYVAKNLSPDEVAMGVQNDPVIAQEFLAPFNERGEWVTPELDRLSTLSGRADPAEMPLKVEPAPNVAYHGSNRKFSEFDPRYIGSGVGKVDHGWGVNLTDDPNQAFDYGRSPNASVYRMQLPDKEALLDWDKPLSAQPDAVREAIKTLLPQADETATGAELYETLSVPGYAGGSRLAGRKQAAEQLKTAGVLGTTYRKEGKTGYVVFDPKDAPILPPDMTAETVPPVHLDIFRSLEGSEDGLVNLDGRVGAFQLNKQEAEAHGFKDANLADPKVNEEVAASIIADLSNKFNGNMEDMVVGWVGGDSAARLWITQGRDFNQLPRNIQRKMLQAEQEGAFGDSTKYESIDLANQYEENGGKVDFLPPERPAAGAGGGGGKKPPTEGEIIPPGEPPPKRIEGYVPTLEERMENVRDIVAPEVRKTWGDTLRALWHGATHVLDTIQSEPRRQDQRTGMTGKTDFGFTDLKRTTFSSRNRVSIFNNTGGVRLSFKGKEPVWTIDKNVPSREQALRYVKEDGGDMEGFLTYWLSAHILELEQAGIRSGATKEQVANARIIQGDKGLVAKYERGLAAMQENKNAALEYAHAAGFWKGDVWATIRGQFSAHMYWGRAFDETTYSMGAGQWGIRPRQPTKEQKGSNRLLNANPLARDGDNSALMIAMADRNVALRGIVDLLQEFDVPGLSLIRDKSAESILARDLETGALLPGELIGPDGKVIPNSDPNLARPLLAEKWAGQKGDGRFVIWRNGEPEVWQASSPEMLELMRLAGPEFSDPISKTFHSVASLAHRGIVGDLFFGLRTLTYGQWTAWMQGGAAPYVSLMEGIFTSLNPKMKGLWEQAKADGALAGWAEDADARYGMMNAEKIFKETGTLDRVWNMAKNPIKSAAKVLQAVNSYLHNASAVGSYAHLQRKGLTPTKAAQKTRELYLDPAERMAHRQLEWWANSTQFFRSTVLDAQSVVRSLDPSKPANLVNWVKLLSGMTTLSIAQVAIQLAQDQNRPDKDKYFNRPRTWRDQSWMFDIGGASFKIKAPPSAITTVFKVFPERLMEYAIKRDPRAFDGLLENLGYNTMPQLVPTLAAPAIENWANKDLHFNGPIVPRSLESLSGDMQYSANTSETAKAVARLVGSQNPMGDWGMSPLHIDNWVREWGGTLPYQLLKTVEGTFNPVERSTDAANIPFLGAFYVRNWGAGQQLDDFYTAFQKWDSEHDSLSKALKRNEPSEIAAHSSPYAKATKVDIGDGVFVSITGVYQSVNQAMAVIRAIDLLPNPSPGQPSGAADVMAGIEQTDKYGLAGIEEKGLNLVKPAMTPDEKRLAIDAIATQIYVVTKKVTEGLDKLAVTPTDPLAN